MAYLTDGFVPEWFVKEKPRGLALAKRLIDSGLWHCAEKDGEQGFQFHDWKPECTKEHVMAVREKARQRKAKQRESQGESRVTDGGTHASVPPTTQPNPTQPIKKNSGREPDEPSVSSATARGTRLPDGWEPHTDVIAQMRSDHPRVDLKAEHAKFTDYWQAKAGRDARKADWNATWRNWIRRAAEQPIRAVNGNHVATSDLRVAQVQALKTQRLEIV
jgi:hypothetical protein